MVHMRGGDHLFLNDAGSLADYLKAVGDISPLQVDPVPVLSGAAAAAGDLQHIRTLIEGATQVGLPKLIQTLRSLLCESNRSKHQYDVKKPGTSSASPCPSAGIRQGHAFALLQVLGKGTLVGDT